MKQFKYILDQNTYTVILIRTNFIEKKNQKHFQFLFQMGEIGAKQGAGWISRTMELWVVTSCFHPRVELSFLPLKSSQKS